MGFLVTFIQKAIGQSIGTLYGALGEMVMKKSDNLNLGIPGMMYMGGTARLIGAFLYGNGTANPGGLAGFLISFVCVSVCTILGGLIYSVLTITLRADQGVTGLALTTFGAGFGNFFGGSLAKLVGDVGQASVAVTGAAYKAPVLGLSKLGVTGQIFFSYRFLTYLVVVLAPAPTFFLAKTRKGLSLRAVSESPATADAAGTDVTAYKYLATYPGGSISGLGGLYFVTEYSDGTQTNNRFGSKGWLAITLVIFTLWKPVNTIWGSVLFGDLHVPYLYIPGLDRGAQKIFRALPYVVTIVVPTMISLGKRREYQSPQGLGLPYFREEWQGFER